MDSEQERTIKALEQAIQMEKDGREFYLKASRESGNEMGRKLLESLAMEEEIHQKTFLEIYNALKAKKGWPTVDFKPDGGRGLRTVFAEVMAVNAASDVKVKNTELSAVETAMDLENKTYDYYQARSDEAESPPEQEFYDSLAMQEREHYLILLDYYEYLKDPGGWFVNKEHPSLD